MIRHIWVSNFKAIGALELGGRGSFHELFGFVLHGKYKRWPLPRDFEQIAEFASLREWQKSASFARIVSILQSWFRKG